MITWAVQHWHKADQALHLVLDTTMLSNLICEVVLSVVCQGRANPLLWETLEHPSSSISAQISIELLEKADRLLACFEAITLSANRGFPCDELLAWFHNRSGWTRVLIRDPWHCGASGLPAAPITIAPWGVPWFPDCAALS